MSEGFLLQSFFYNDEVDEMCFTKCHAVNETKKRVRSTCNKGYFQCQRMSCCFLFPTVINDERVCSHILCQVVVLVRSE